MLSNKSSEFFNVLVLPDYVLKALNSKGIDLNTIDRLAKEELSSYDMNVNDWYKIKTKPEAIAKNRLIKVLFSKLSTIDQRDVIVANGIVNSKFKIPTYVLDMVIKRSITDDEKKDFIDLYTDISVDINSIIMSNNDVNTNVPFSIKTLDNIILIVLEKGFFNFITYDVKLFPSFFLGIFINYLYKMYGEEVTFKSEPFRYFMRLQNTI